MEAQPPSLLMERVELANKTHFSSDQSVYEGVTEDQLVLLFMERLELAKKNRERYVAKVSTSIEETRSLCDFIDTEGRETVEQLNERLTNLGIEQRACDDKQMERSALHDSVIEVSGRVQDLESNTARLSDALEHLNQLLSTGLEEIDKSLEEKKRKNESMLEAQHWYDRNLGFRIKPTKNNGLWIILTKVVPAGLDQEFSFSIRHDKQRNLYTLLECNPDIARSKDVVKELNRTNDFLRFIFNMRKMFQAEFSDEKQSGSISFQ